MCWCEWESAARLERTVRRWSALGACSVWWMAPCTMSSVQVVHYRPVAEHLAGWCYVPRLKELRSKNVHSEGKTGIASWCRGTRRDGYVNAAGCTASLSRCSTASPPSRTAGWLVVEESRTAAGRHWGSPTAAPTRTWAWRWAVRKSIVQLDLLFTIRQVEQRLICSSAQDVAAVREVTLQRAFQLKDRLWQIRLGEIG